MARGMSASGMLATHLACLLARRYRPYAAEVNVGKVRLNEYGQVRRFKGITSVVLVMGSSSSSGRTGSAEFSYTCIASRPTGDVGSPVACICVSWLLMIVVIVSLRLTS